MLRYHIFLSVFFVASFFLGSCEKTEPYFPDNYGKKPVYISQDELRDIHNEPPRVIQQSGTIFLQDTLLFVLEQGKGIHVYDIKDSLNTVNLTFFKIPAITDFLIVGHLLYANSWKDLVVINFSDLFHIQETDRLVNVVNPILYPPLYNGIFECVDESKGAVVFWEDAYIENAKCYTIN